MHAIEFWYEFGSTYSYPSAMRIDRMAEEVGIKVEWRPFLLGPIFRAQGWSDSPFNIYPAMGRYMWRDLERVCADLSLPFVRPSAFPRNGLLAARVACLYSAEPWVRVFSRAVYRANFVEDLDIANSEVILECLNKLGLNGRELLQQAASTAGKAKLRTQTDQAVRAGIFGAPTFIIGKEMFWGNDRLEQALTWAAPAGAADIGSPGRG